ncbi:MAG: RluA family pseudouridine synthase, partial [Hungateiclostridium thermocellum]|nr:RluA family pseudouridine synthase [Acetivibrio thermocellus]
MTVIAPHNAAGERTDVFLAKALSGEFSRARIQSLIRDGQVTANGNIVSRTSAKVKAGDVFDIRVPPPEKWDLKPEPIPLDIVYEDEDILVINKPRGMVVHPALGHREGTLVHAILSHVPGLAGIGGELRPGIVHRLDKDTTGLLVVAKNENSLRELQRQ